MRTPCRLDKRSAIRHTSSNFGANHAVCDILNCEAFHEEHLYANLDWLQEHQADIENQLFRRLQSQETRELFWYDVTSSYLEGKHNELAACGYNRDHKRGKRQIVIGLLCDGEGTPLSIEVFSGNTADTQTFGRQVAKVAERFGAPGVTFVGDRGMIKGPQIEQLQQDPDHEFHYITAISKPQIEKLLREDKLQLDLFDQEFGEVQREAGVRFVLRRNPLRAKEIKQSREDKYQALSQLVEAQNAYLLAHPKAKPATAERKIESKSKKLKIDGWTYVSCEERTLSVAKDTEQLQELAKLDGCYVLN